MMNRRRFLNALAALSLAGLSFKEALAEESLRMIVPYPAGGPLDATARVLAEMLYPLRGKVIVENRPGAAGARGLLALKEEKPDGQTLAMGAVATLAVNPLLRSNLPYAPEDFVGVCLLSNVPNVLVMTEKRMQALGVTSLNELLSYIRNNPGKLNAASGGNGSAGHIIGELLGTQGLRTEHIAFAGASAAQLSLLSGETDLMFDNWASAKAAVADGRLRVLAQTVAVADPDIPAPTLASLGLICDISTWFGLIAPKGTSETVREKLFNDIAGLLAVESNLQKFAQASGSRTLLSPAAFEAFIADEQAKYRDILQTMKLN